jgi:solute:Na+ symporter, SSS family
MLLAWIVLYLLLNVAVGYWASRRVHSTQDYVLAGRRLGLGLATMVTFATWFGSETMMGAPGEFVNGGILAVIEEPFGAALCLILVGLFFAKTFYRLNILTFCDFFERRFGTKAELISAFLIVPSYFSWITAQFVAMGVIMHLLTGLSLLVGIVIGASLVMVYTLLGGMWSLSITDFFHNILLILGLLVVAFVVFGQAGGWAKVVDQTPAQFFSPIPIQHNLTSWTAYLMAWATIGLGSIPQQDVFQRVMSAKNEDIAQKSALLAGVFYISIALLPLFIALAASQLHPELLQGDSKMILLHMVVQYSPAWVQVLFFGALISAIMSTSSGAILAPASVIGENIIRPFWPKISDSNLLLSIRIAVVVVTMACIYMASFRQNIYELVSESSAFSLVSLFVPMLAGLYWRQASSTGAILSMVVGAAAWFGATKSNSPWPAPLIGLVFSGLGMIFGSIICPNKQVVK